MPVFTPRTLFEFEYSLYPDERWCPIPQFEDLYQISNYGRILATEQYIVSPIGQEFIKPAQFIQPIIQHSGYAHVGLWRNGTCAQKRVHRLVAHAFVPNSDPIHKTQVNHLDENKLNNCASNLEWCTP